MSDLCGNCGSDVSVCGERLCQQERAADDCLHCGQPKTRHMWIDGLARCPIVGNSYHSRAGIAALRAEVERLREHLKNAERIGMLGYPMHRTIDNHDGMLFVIRAALRGEEGT